MTSTTSSELMARSDFQGLVLEALLTVAPQAPFPPGQCRVSQRGCEAGDLIETGSIPGSVTERPGGAP